MPASGDKDYAAANSSGIVLQAVVKVITSGSPRLFNPTAAAWYDRYMGVGNYIRLVNNRDVVPSLPLRHTPCAPIPCCRKTR